MAGSAESPSPTVATSEERPATTSSRASEQRSRLTAVLLWVGIAAGVVFIVAVLFFSGFFLGRQIGWHRGYDGNRTVPSGTCPMMGTGGQMPMGPGGMMGPGGGMGPGGMTPGGMTPGDSPPGGMSPGRMTPGESAPGGMTPGGASTDPHHPPTSSSNPSTPRS